MEVTKSKEPTQGTKEEQKPELDSAIIDELMKGYQRPEDMTGPGGILEQLTKRVYERILGAEMTHYLGYEKDQAPQSEEGKKQKNYRNGTSKKTLLSEDGKLEIDGPVPGILAAARPGAIMDKSGRHFVATKLMGHPVRRAQSGPRPASVRDFCHISNPLLAYALFP